MVEIDSWNTIFLGPLGWSISTFQTISVGLIVAAYRVDVQRTFVTIRCWKSHVIRRPRDEIK